MSAVSTLGKGRLYEKVKKVTKTDNSREFNSLSIFSQISCLLKMDRNEEINRRNEVTKLRKVKPIL